MHLSFKISLFHYFAAIVLVFASSTFSSAQHQGHEQRPQPKAVPTATPTPTPHRHDTETSKPVPTPSPSPSPAHTHTPGMPMPATSPAPEDTSETGPLLLVSGSEMGIRVGGSQTNVMSMSAMGSGTSLQPSSGPTYMHHWQKDDWLVMFHYNFIGALNRQGGPRGVTKAESANWFMPAAYRRVGNGTLQLRGMISAEPFTFPPGGSPLLFQTGETYKGDPIIDRQHPHDLFMELSAQYTMPLGERGTWFTYFAYPGEPAIGPVAFMHRMSASENPSATLSHHLQDSTHIAFGVFTTGFSYRWLKFEASIFNGREPDEGRYDFDAHKWNSRSARLWVIPNRNWAFQISHGFLKSPEVQHPGVDIRRTTASMQYNKPLNRGNLAAAFVWGRNHLSEPGEVRNLNSYTGESSINFLDRNYLYTRLELVDKDELLRDADRTLLGVTDHHAIFRIGAYTFGAVRDLWATNSVQFGIGSDITFYSKPAILDALYGKNPVSWKLFFRIRPGKMDMSSHGTHGTHQ